MGGLPPPPPMLGKWARVGQKLLFSLSKIDGTFSNFAIKFHNLSSIWTNFAKI